MKEIPLTQGKIALVDDEDYEYLCQFNWYARKDKRTYYAVRSVHLKNGKVYSEHMHRVIMNTTKGNVVDHIDHNGLNNQKYNLRNCTPNENRLNRTVREGCEFMGVSKHTYFIARINNGNERICLGRFKTAKEAAMAYDEAAKKYHGEFASLNFK